MYRVIAFALGRPVFEAKVGVQFAPGGEQTSTAEKFRYSVVSTSRFRNAGPFCPQRDGVRDGDDWSVLRQRGTRISTLKYRTISFVATITSGTYTVASVLSAFRLASNSWGRDGSGRDGMGWMG